MNSKLVVALSVGVIVVLAGAFLIAVQPGGPASTTSVSSSTSTQSTTSIGGSYANSPDDLQLQLSVYASSSGGTSGGVAIQMYISEYNTLASANNVSKGSEWGLQGLSLGACGTEAYPFGVALYRGSYSAANVSQATPLRIYPVVACPMLLRLITSYLFQPNSDLAVILPGSDATPTPMSQNVTATTEYSTGAGFVASSSPLGPGTYSVAAGDEWGAVTVIHFTVRAGSTTSTTTSTTVIYMGALDANFTIGPTQPVCSANSTVGPAPAQYSSIEAIITSQQSGQNTTLPIAWTSNGCSASGSFEAPLPSGSYSLDLSNCTFMGCSSALPKSFTVAAGQATSVEVSIDTGIR